MSAGPRAAHRLPGRALVSGWGWWRRKHGEGGARCGKGWDRAMACPRVPPLGCKQHLLGHAQGACPGIPFQARGGPCVQLRRGAARRSQPGTGPAALGPALALLQGTERGDPGSVSGGSRHNAVGSPRGTAGTRGGREREQRTRGRMERRDAPWHRHTNARTGGQRGPRHGRASGGDGAGGTRQGGSLPRTRLCTRSAERGARSSRC